MNHDILVALFCVGSPLWVGAYAWHMRDCLNGRYVTDTEED